MLGLCTDPPPLSPFKSGLRYRSSSNILAFPSSCLSSSSALSSLFFCRLTHFPFPFTLCLLPSLIHLPFLCPLSVHRPFTTDFSPVFYFAVTSESSFLSLFFRIFHGLCLAACSPCFISPLPPSKYFPLLPAVFRSLGLACLLRFWALLHFTSHP